jgi:hypothetical protein
MTLLKVKTSIMLVELLYPFLEIWNKQQKVKWYKKVITSAGSNNHYIVEIQFIHRMYCIVTFIMFWSSYCH